MRKRLNISAVKLFFSCYTFVIFNTNQNRIKEFDNLIEIRQKQSALFKQV